MVLAPAHAVFNAPPCVFMTLTHALAQLDDGRTIEDVNTVMALTRDVQDGWNGVRAISSYQRLDAIMAFGKTSALVGLPDIEVFAPTTINIRSQVAPVRFVRLPSPINPWWVEDEAPRIAGEAAKPLLMPALPTIHAGGHLAWDAAEFN